METAEIQASLQSPLFSRLVEDGDRRCDLIWASPVTCCDVAFFLSTLCAETDVPGCSGMFRVPGFIHAPK